jgi:hypothetical protein
MIRAQPRRRAPSTQVPSELAPLLASGPRAPCPRVAGGGASPGPCALPQSCTPGRFLLSLTGSKAATILLSEYLPARFGGRARGCPRAAPAFSGLPRLSRSVRTAVYVDAFNLYYGCLKDTPYRCPARPPRAHEGRRHPEPAAETEPCALAARHLPQADPARCAGRESVPEHGQGRAGLLPQASRSVAASPPPA